MAEHTELGKWGEEQACLLLESKGYEVIDRNWRYEKAEIDIICIMEQEVIFVEVKTTMTDEFGEPEEQVTHTKERLITNAADHYIEEKDIDKEARFDIISIIKKNKSIKHIEDAFRPRIR